jgi:predicted GTPase
MDKKVSVHPSDIAKAEKEKATVLVDMDEIKRVVESYLKNFSEIEHVSRLASIIHAESTGEKNEAWEQICRMLGPIIASDRYHPYHLIATCMELMRYKLVEAINHAHDYLKFKGLR